MTDKHTNHSEVRERLAGILNRINKAASRAGRDPAGILLVAVSKTFGPEKIREAFEAGVTHFGENRVQEARRKIPWCPKGITWHFVGHLQTNKVRYVIQLFQWVHSIDRMSLIEAFDQMAKRHTFKINVFVQVNLSGEPQKSGCSPDETLVLVREVLERPFFTFKGLMTLPPYHPDPEKSRPYFRELRQLGEDIRSKLSNEGYSIEEMGYSMGMSHDFEVAIEEGATVIRLGEAIFGPRETG